MPPEARAESQNNRPEAYPPIAVPITSMETAAFAAAIAVASEYTNRNLPPLTIDAVNYAQSKFSLMDGNNDGKVSHYELDGYIKANQSGMSKEESAIVHQIKDHRQRIADASDDDAGQAFTQQDLYHMKNRFTPEQRAAAQSEGVADLRPALSYANKNFDKLDSDKNGFVNNNEIAKYMSENQNLTAEEKGMLRSLRDRSSTIQQSSTDGDKPEENKGFSKKDLSASNEEINNLSFASENFKVMDANGNGHVTKEEITGYERARENLTGDDLRALDALRNKVEKLEDNHDDEFRDDNDGYTGHDVLDGLVSWGSPTAKGMRKLEDPVSAPPAAATPPETPPATPPETPPATPPEGTPPEAPPEGTPPETAPEAGDPNQESVHTVERGDTLWRICADELRSRNNGQSPSHRDILGAIEAVKNFNPGVDPLRLRPGSELKIPKDLSLPPGAELTPHPRQPRRPADPPVAIPRPGDPPAPPIAAPPEERPVPGPPVDSTPPQAEERQQSNADILREHFRGIDRTRDGRVSREEITEYRRVMGRRLSDRDDEALRVMAEQEHRIQELENDETGEENSGISYADLAKAEEMRRVARYLQNNDLEQYNFNGDPVLDQRELHYAENSPYTNSRDRLMLQTLRAYYDDFRKGSKDGNWDRMGVSGNDLDYYANIF